MFTPYAAAKRVNEELKKAGVDKVIPPQMMYNYTKARFNAGKKPFIEFSLENGIDEKDFERWLKAYLDKQVKSAPSEVKEEVES